MTTRARRKVPSKWADISQAERVAVIYLGATARGLPPTSIVAEVFGVTGSVAAKLVQAARCAGFIPPTRPGRKMPSLLDEA